jgi:hypothetical protein
MSREDFWFGFTCGAIAGIAVMVALSIQLRDRGYGECESKPRTQICTQVWVPEARSKP